jgi:hypothetical protein
VFTEKRVVYFHRKKFFYHRIKVALSPREPKSSPWEKVYFPYVYIK